MRIFLLSFLLSLSALAMQGADFTYLTFQTEDGSEYSVVASGLSISFQDGNLVASDGTSLPLTNLRKMYFSNASNISGLAGEKANGMVTVYNLQGKLLGSYPSLSEATAAMGKGLFLIKEENGKTQKKVVK